MNWPSVVAALSSRGFRTEFVGVLPVYSPYHAVLAVKGCARFACSRPGGRCRPLTACAAACFAGLGQSRPNKTGARSCRTTLFRTNPQNFSSVTRKANIDWQRATKSSRPHAKSSVGGSVGAHVVRDYLRTKIAELEHEVFVTLLLDSQNRLIEYIELFRGTLAQTSVYPREVVKVALSRNAAAMILAHNHPSGVAEPSRADELLTQSLKQALALVDVRVLDHFVVAGAETVSFAERGLL